MFVIFGSIKDNLILYTAGIVLLTAILTKSVDNYYMTRKEQEEKIGTLRKKIRIFLYLWENEHRSVEATVKDLSRYLINEILPSKKAFSEAIYKDLGELYGLTNSIDINPSITCKNYKSKEWETKNKKYNIDEMERILKLCKENENIK